MTWQCDPDAGTHPAAEELAEYADGGMERRRAEQIATHLRACAACRAEAASYGPMLDLLRALPERPAPRSFRLDELADRREARSSAWPAWASLAASVVLAFGMIAALLGPGGGGGTASLTSTGAGDAAYAPAADQESGGAAMEAAPDTGEAPQESAVSPRASQRAAEGGVADSADAAAAPSEPASAGAQGVSATAVTAEGAAEESDGEDEPTLAAAAGSEPTAGAAPERAEAGSAAVTAVGDATRAGRTSGASAPSSAPSPAAALFPSGAPTLAAAGAPEATGAPAIAQADPQETARDATREAEAPSAGGNVPLGLALGALSALALGLAVVLFRRARAA